MNDKLLPCPFCGNDAQRIGEGMDYGLRAKCVNNDCRLGQITGSFTADDWNTRTPPAGKALVNLNHNAEARFDMMYDQIERMNNDDITNSDDYANAMFHYENAMHDMRSANRIMAGIIAAA